jgi:hypothetical protein
MNKSLAIKEMQIKTTLNSSHQSQTGSHQENKQQILMKTHRKRKPHTMLVGT